MCSEQGHLLQSVKADADVPKEEAMGESPILRQWNRVIFVQFRAELLARTGFDVQWIEQLCGAELSDPRALTAA